MCADEARTIELTIRMAVQGISTEVIARVLGRPVDWVNAVKTAWQNTAINPTEVKPLTSELRPPVPYVYEAARRSGPIEIRSPITNMIYDGVGRPPQAASLRATYTYDRGNA